MDGSIAGCQLEVDDVSQSGTRGTVLVVVIAIATQLSS